MLLKEYGTDVSGPLEELAPGFAAMLAERGFARLSIRNHVNVFAYASRWLEHENLAPKHLTVAQVERLLQSRRNDGYTCWLSMRGLTPLLEYLRSVSAVPPEQERVARGYVERLIERYHQHLVEERSLSSSTVKEHCKVTSEFLVHHRDAPSVRSISAGDVRLFFRAKARGFSTAHAAHIGGALRSLLRFLHVEGILPVSMVNAVPSVSGWRLTSLPQILSQQTVRLLLESCDRRTLYGRRDFAVLMLLARLGLRAGEVVRLTLEDLEWRTGQLVIHGKGQTVARLPLPNDVGEALSAYLLRRPAVAYRAVFLRGRAPLEPVSVSAIHAITTAASLRAGVPRVFPHKLRHALASEILRRGGSLAEIAQVLRHKNLSTTAIYAKVDRVALRELAQPWPGGAI